MREYLQYFRACVEIALRGSLQSATNWAGVVGVAVVGAVLQYIMGQFQELVPYPGWQGVVAAALIYIFAAWLVVFLCRLIFVAPYRLYQKYRRPPALERLNEFYVEVGPLIGRKLPKDDTASFEAYLNEANTWTNGTAKWIEDSLGKAARARFLDTTGIMAAYVQGAVNERHNDVLQKLIKFRQNLSALIENEASR
jgi:hypothetical protein